MMIVVYSAASQESIQASLGEPEYSYYFVLRAFLPVLRSLAEVQVVSSPAEEVDPIFHQCRSRGEYCVFLSFCPPDQLNLELECPTIPVFAWEFENIPNEMWDNNIATDWRYCLSRAGSAITHSTHTVANVQKNVRMGFPIVSAPAPVWDHYSSLPIQRRGSSTGQSFELNIDDGYLIDTDHLDLDKFSPNNRSRSHIPPPLSQSEVLTLGGVVYTAILNPRDGRKNWMDVFWTFCWAFKEQANATLVIKLTCYDPEQMIDVLLYDLYKLSPFKCRVVAISGYLSDRDYEKLAASSSYAVNASRGEGQCLPLMEFMSCGVPAISPRHTALLDYVNDSNTFLVDSSLEPSHWPHDPRQYYRTLRHRIDWESLTNAYLDSFNTIVNTPHQYRKMSRKAVDDLKKYCSSAVVKSVLKAFLSNQEAVFRVYSSPVSDTVLQKFREFWRRSPSSPHDIPHQESPLNQD
jgi:glycosyltransferase involved in cell wall biosynthesis